MWNSFFFVSLLSLGTALLYPSDDDDKRASWSQWSPCSVSCGEGVSFRYRKFKDFNLNLRPPRDTREVTTGTSQATEDPEDEFGFVFIQDDLTGRRKKDPYNSLFDEETRKCKNMDCDKTGILFACTFDRGMCNMIQDVEDNLHWSPAFAKTRKGDRFKTSDNLGGYIRVVANQPHEEEMAGRAAISTPFLPKSKYGYCVYFWYKMYGSEGMSLKVLLQAIENNRVVTEEEVWKRNGNSGDVWIRDFLSLPPSNEDIRLTFVATVDDAPFVGEMALDDISVDSSLCIL